MLIGWWKRRRAQREAEIRAEGQRSVAGWLARAHYIHSSCGHDCGIAEVVDLIVSSLPGDGQQAYHHCLAAVRLGTADDWMFAEWRTQDWDTHEDPEEKSRANQLLSQLQEEVGAFEEMVEDGVRSGSIVRGQVDEIDLDMKRGVATVRGSCQFTSPIRWVDVPLNFTDKDV